MMIPWVIIMIMIDENNTMIDLTYIDSNINDEKKEKVKQWGICICVDARGKREKVRCLCCITPVYLFFFFSNNIVVNETEEKVERCDTNADVLSTSSSPL